MRTVVGLRARLPIGLLAEGWHFGFGRIGACTTPGNSPEALSASGGLAQLGTKLGPVPTRSRPPRTSLGDGSTGRQIFIWQHFNWVCQNGKPTPPTFALCPNPPEPFPDPGHQRPRFPDHPSVSDTFETNATFPTPPLAQWVAFEADGSYNGSTGCEASRRRFFLFEVFSHDCASSRLAATVTARTRRCRSTPACSPSSRRPAVSRPAPSARRV